MAAGVEQSARHPDGHALEADVLGRMSAKGKQCQGRIRLQAFVFAFEDEGAVDEHSEAGAEGLDPERIHLAGLQHRDG